jgi:hypothetical protein
MIRWIVKTLQTSRKRAAVHRVFDAAARSGDVISALNIAKHHGITMTKELILSMQSQVANASRTGGDKARQYMALMDPFHEATGVPVHVQFVNVILELDPRLKAEVCKHRMNGLLRIKFLTELLAERSASPSDIYSGLKNVPIWPQSSDTIQMCQDNIEYALKRGDVMTAYSTAMLLPAGRCLPQDLWDSLLKKMIKAWGAGDEITRSMLVNLSDLSLKT